MARRPARVMPRRPRIPCCGGLRKHLLVHLLGQEQDIYSAKPLDCQGHATVGLVGDGQHAARHVAVFRWMQ
jgi:hypothetical protein